MTIVLSTAVDIGFKAAYSVRGGCSTADICEDATLARLRWEEVARWGGTVKCPGLKTCARKETGRDRKDRGQMRSHKHWKPN